MSTPEEVHLRNMIASKDKEIALLKGTCEAALNLKDQEIRRLKAENERLQNDLTAAAASLAMFGVLKSA